MSETPLETAENAKIALTRAKIKNVKIIKRAPIGEIIPLSYELKIDNDTLAFVYEPVSCHNYNEIKINNKIIKIATIDTIMNFYLAFLYADKPYYDTNRLLCITKIMFEIQQKHRLENKGLLERFTMKCYGKSLTLQGIKEEKADKFIELKDKKGTDEYDEWFLSYNPASKPPKSDSNKRKTHRKRRRQLFGTRSRRKYWDV